MWRSALWITGLMVGGGVAASLAGIRPGWGVAISLAISAAWVVARVIIVRLAHSAFRVGNYGRASGLYWLLRWLYPSRAAREATRVSRAACQVGLADYRRALTMLDAITAGKLDEAARAAWLNNRAYALARLGEQLQDALDASSRAVSLRPTLAGFRHTRGVVLLALGRFQEAVRDLDEVWKQTADESALLESERCYDLGMAWQGLGETDYALDYFERARRAVPGNRWADLAEAELGPRAERAGSVADLVP
ncbi:MAG: tetratricopeptide repeat protein [Deltaproteobacteria bacterium]|nr:tetratricopeptide repeat protein [Deltaproteobacteria bacterium]